MDNFKVCKLKIKYTSKLNLQEIVKCDLDTKIIGNSSDNTSRCFGKKIVKFYLPTCFNIINNNNNNNYIAPY